MLPIRLFLPQDWLHNYWLDRFFRAISVLFEFFTSFFLVLVPCGRLRWLAIISYHYRIPLSSLRRFREPSQPNVVDALLSNCHYCKSQPHKDKNVKSWGISQWVTHWGDASSIRQRWHHVSTVCYTTATNAPHVVTCVYFNPRKHFTPAKIHL